MKKILPFLLVLLSLDLFSQAKISEMVTYTGDPSGGYVPIVIGGVNRKVDAANFGYTRVDSVVISSGNLVTYKNGIAVRTQALPSATLGYTAENVANKNATNGYAGIDNTGKIPITLLPTGSLVYKGVWNASTNAPALTNGSGTNGWQYNVGTAGTANLGAGAIAFSIGDMIIYNGTTWERNPAGNTVLSVNGLQGNLTLTAGEIAPTTARTYTSAAERTLWNAAAPLASPAFTGVPTATTALTGDRSTRIATTDFVGQEIRNAPGLNFRSPGIGFRIVKSISDTIVGAKNWIAGAGMRLDSTDTTITVSATGTGGSSVTSTSSGYKVLTGNTVKSLLPGNGGSLDSTTTPGSIIINKETTIQGAPTTLYPIVAGGIYYMGSINLSAASSTAGLLRMWIPRSGTISEVSIQYSMANATGGVFGSATEVSTFTLVKNGVTNATIQSVNWGSVVQGRIYNSAMSMAVVKGDYVEIKVTIPTPYAVLPTQARFAFYFIIK